MKNFSFLFKLSAILWLIWGAVHILAGVLTLNGIFSGNYTQTISGIADAINPETLSEEYHPALGAILSQHGWNLLWSGLSTFIAAFFVWKGRKNAIYLAALIGGLADLGYFLFLDLGGFVNFIPGSLMTIISGSAILISLYAHWAHKAKA